jgi:hypothetical protein
MWLFVLCCPESKHLKNQVPVARAPFVKIYSCTIPGCRYELSDSDFGKLGAKKSGNLAGRPSKNDKKVKKCQKMFKNCLKKVANVVFAFAGRPVSHHSRVAPRNLRPGVVIV